MTKKYIVPLFLFIGFGFAFWLHTSHYLPFISDDALISLRYSDRLLDGHGLTWTAGIPVEGYSNLLWVLLTSLLGFLGIDLILSARILGFSSILLTFFSFIYVYRQKSSLWPAFLGILILTLSGPIAVWSIGGLEQPLIACLLAWSIALSYPLFEDENFVSTKRIWLLSFFLAALNLTRPDSPLFTAALIFSLLIVHRFSKPVLVIALKIISLPLLAFVGQTVFRFFYYGEWVPNTALVKMSPSYEHFLQGWTYVKEGFWALQPFSSLFLFVFGLGLFEIIRDKRLFFLFITSFAWTFYVMFIGGDIFPAWRHLIPSIVLMSFTLALGLENFLKQFSLFSYRFFLLLFLSGISCFYFYGQFHGEKNNQALTERWEWDGKILSEILKKGFWGKKPLFAASAVGCLGYFTKFPMIDTLGLNDYYLPRHPPKDFGKGWLGHELGDGNYILSRNPDLISFCLPRESGAPCFRGEYELVELPGFKSKYIPVTFKAEKKIFTLWLNQESSLIGLKKEENRISFPSYLLRSSSRIVVELDSKNQFFVRLFPHKELFINPLSIPAGLWEVEIDSDVPVKVEWSLGTEKQKGPLNLSEPALVNFYFQSEKSGKVKNITLKRQLFPLNP